MVYIYFFHVLMCFKILSSFTLDARHFKLQKKHEHLIKILFPRIVCKKRKKRCKNTTNIKLQF